MLTGKPHVLKSFNYRGPHRYFLTFCTFERRRLLITSERVDLAWLQIRRAAVEQWFAITAYCFMPDHAHLLIEGQVEGSDCQRFIARAKQYSGFYFQRQFGERLWQRYGWERTLREHDTTVSVVRYIIENPVRAGLVQAAAEYPFCGSYVYSMTEIAEAVQIGGDWNSRSA